MHAPAGPVVNSEVPAEARQAADNARRIPQF